MAPDMVDVPASLDLVDRAQLGLNGLLGTLDPQAECECYFLTFFASNPQYMVHWSSMISGVMPKYLEAIALLRSMTHGTHLHDVEEGMLDAVRRNIAEDGLIYDRADPRRPWNVGVGYGKQEWNEDYSCLAGDGRLLCAMDFYYQLTGDEWWKAQMQRTSERMLELAITRDDYAFYPDVQCGNDFSWPRQTGWRHTDEPHGPAEGQEGATTFYLALPIRGWMRWYRHSGDDRMLDMSRRFARFVMKPQFWGGKSDPLPDYGKHRARWSGHVHGTLAAFRGILEYALGAQDYQAMEFVRDGYEWARHHLCAPLGCDAGTEGCALGDLAALGIQLSDAGICDLWDDVDALARNALLEAQFTDADGLRALGEAASGKAAHWGGDPVPGQETIERVVERNLGAISHSVIAGSVQEPMMMSCCTANATQAYYYVWEAIVRCEGDCAVVNLLMNRFSPWLDVASHLPYEGKVVITNRSARRIHVRIPAWVPRPQLSCQVNGRPVSSAWAGRYVEFGDLRPGDVLDLEFPLLTHVRELVLSSVNGAEVVRLSAEFRGSTCLSTRRTDGEAATPPGIPLFQREAYRSASAPMQKVPRHAPERLIRWY